MEFKDIAQLENLKEFLSTRDNDPIYAPVKARGGVGIPLFVKDSVRSFEWNDLL